jgi:hypothetical protein
MSPRAVAAGCLVLTLLTGSCARPVYKADAVAEAPGLAAAPEPAPVQPAAAPPPAPASAAAAPADLFASSVRPILEAHCTPCHFPGGKMYERLPFDKPETLASHREGALRRLKGDDRAAFEAWLRTLP